jgi:TPR repeat protein
MASMNLDEPRRMKGSNNGPDPGRRGPPGGDGYGRPSGESQRAAPPRAYPPQQAGYGGPQNQRLGPGPGAGYGRSPQNSYGAAGYDQGYAQPSSSPTPPLKDSFGPPPRSMTMPSDIGMNAPYGQANGTSRYLQQGTADGLGPSAPYNGPVGRGPPRAMTANGSRLPPQRPYPQEPLQQLYQNGKSNEQDHSHQQKQSISDLYDAYYEPSPQADGTRVNGENSSGMPGFDTTPVRSGSHQRRMSDIEDRLQPDNSAQGPMPQRQQVNGYQLMTRTKSQPDFRAQVQPQSAVYEMASDAPPLPNGPPKQGHPSERYDQYGNKVPYPQNGQKALPMGRGYDGSDRSPQGYNQPGQRQNGPTGWGLPSGPSPHINNGPMLPRTNSLPKPNSQANPDALPAHPVPIRAGLIPNSVANQPNNRPPPVRNYNNTGPATPAQGQSSLPGPDDSLPSHLPVTLDELERLKVMVKNDPNDQATQLTLARKYVEASEVLIDALPDQKSRNKARERYIFDAHKLLKKLVAVQNAEAMFYLADCYGRGSLGLEADNKEAFSLYQSAAKAGHAAAAYRTAVCCELGNEEGGTRKDPLKAVQWYKRAATLGDTSAMYKMGTIQLKGLLGQPQNSREAIVWLKRAAERADAENPHALHELGLLYEAVQPPDGSGIVIRDEAYALSLFTQAAELGYKFSQFRLGSAYEYGLFNLKIDPRLSIMWYSSAAVQEEHQSELALSGWYLTGSDGVLQQSDTEAYLWARKAAMAGLAKAEYAMGYFTEVGIGTPADLEAAKRWYWRAAGMSLRIYFPYPFLVGHVFLFLNL